MRITDMNWMQVEAYLKTDDRCIVPLGSTEQHAYLSLSVDSLLAERVALEAAEPLGIPVFPVLHYGVAPYFRAYPGTITLKVQTYIQIVQDILESLRDTGFKRILIVNGHGGNRPAGALAQEWALAQQDVRVKFHNWWNAPKTWAKVGAIHPVGTHASWMENFPWTRLAGVAMPEAEKPKLDLTRLDVLNIAGQREFLQDGNFGGPYQMPDEDMMALWAVAVDETRALLTDNWGTA
jgi:creatinine amidohydrolase